MQSIKRTVKLLYNGEKVEKTLVFKEVAYSVARKMIINNHYSHKWNASFGVINIGVYHNDKLLGVAVFGSLMNPSSYKKFNKDFQSGDVLELNRLWVDDELGGNTETVLLKASFDFIRNLRPNVKCIQSFADGRLGVGTIYKAMSFDYYGYSETLFYEHDSGEIYHSVPMENTKRPKGMIDLNVKWIKGELKPLTVKTYRYIFPLYKKIKIDLVKQEYPKYEKGFLYSDNYKHNNRLIARACLLAELFNYENENKLLEEYLIKNNLEYLLDEEKQNKTILQFEEQIKPKDGPVPVSLF